MCETVLVIVGALLVIIPGVTFWIGMAWHIRDMARVREAFWREEELFWDAAAEGPCKDGDDFIWAMRLAERARVLRKDSML